MEMSVPGIIKEKSDFFSKTRVQGIKRSVSSRRREGDGFDARPKLRHS